MSSSLYVGNIPYSMKWGELKDMFKEVGEVEFADVPRTHDGKSRGFGVVKMATPEDAEKAIQSLNGVEVKGRALVVRLDERVKAKENQVFVGNLSWSVKWQDLKDLAKEKDLNPIRADVTVGRDGRSRGWGLLVFETPEEANKAIEVLNGVEYKERVLEVKHDNR